MRITLLLLNAILVAGLAWSDAPAKEPTTDLVRDGARPLPIVIAPDAPASVKRAADDLAKIISRISGATPEVLTSAPAQGGAIWVGPNEKLAALFPDADLSWKYPEEILILIHGSQAAILGRDRQEGGTEIEAGTANAVYTFAQKYLGVRWLWPGTLGDDYPAATTISLPDSTYRFHPLFVQRAVFRNINEPTPNSQADWCLRQRLYYDSFNFPASHGFGDWWDKYGKTHPEYFALQPDGTRGTFPERSNRKKLCEGEPGVWKQWLAEADEEIAANPALRILNASPNDSANSGVCVDPRSKAWDNPKAKLWRYEWAAGVSKEEPALTNRYVTFWNILAGQLKDKYPGKELYVCGFAYGPTKPPPIDLKVADNIAIGYVGHLPMLDEKQRLEEYEEIKEWAKLTKNLFLRPNVALYSGGFHAIPAVTFKNTIKDFRFLAENGCRGLVLDTLPDHWGTQGPMYYLMAQLAWDPLQDGEAVLADYYERGFGPAARPVRAYFDLMEAAHTSIIERPDWLHSGRMAKPLSEFMISEAYTPEILAKSRALLQEAAAAAKGDPKYFQRVEFVTKGLDFTEKLIATMKLMNRVRDSKGKDVAAVEEAVRLVAEREAFFDQENAAAKKAGSIPPISSHRFKVTYVTTRGMADYLGPVSETFQKAAAAEKAQPTQGRAESGKAEDKAGPVATAGTEFRWTGRAGNKLWATPGNWEVKTKNGWEKIASPPGPGSTVYLGGEAAPNKREINLTANTKVARLFVVAPDEGAYVIQTRPDADTEGLDSDSGMLFTLTLTDPDPIQQQAQTKSPLRIASKLALTGTAKPAIHLDSTGGAAIEIQGKLVSGQPVEKRGEENSVGRLLIDPKGQEN